MKSSSMSMAVLWPRNQPRRPTASLVGVKTASAERWAMLAIVMKTFAHRSKVLTFVSQGVPNVQKGNGTEL